MAILAEAPRYGNQLRADVDERTGHATPVNVGQIYNTLDRLERDRLVEKLAPDGDGQSNYRITAAGRAEFERWRDEPGMPDAGERDEFAEKVVVLLSLPGSDPHAVIDRARGAALERRAALETEAPRDAMRRRMRDAAIELSEARLRWLEALAAELAAESAAVPLSTAVPRRGRPRKAVT
nr:PadR family transcriptional regulator [Galbitalea soli]